MKRNTVSRTFLWLAGLLLVVAAWLLIPAQIARAGGPIVTWNPVAGAAGYMLDLNGSVTKVGNSTSYTAGVLADDTCTWTDAVYADMHNVSAYADDRTFAMNLIPPDPPVLDAPADGAVISDTTPALSWHAVASAVGYLVDLDGNIIDVGNATVYTTSVLTDGIHTWTVAAYDTFYTGAYTDTWSFNVDTVLPNVVDVTPPDETNSVPINTPIVVDFDEAMDTNNVNYLITPTTNLTPTWGNDDARLTLTHEEFVTNTLHTVTIVAGSDPAGNPLNNAPYTWVFTTSAVSVPIADLALGKARVGTGNVIAGERITYTFTVTNAGPTTPVTATIVDTFNDASALAGVSGEGCIWLDTEIVTCTVTGIVTDSPSVLTLVVTTDNTYSGTLSNVAHVARSGEVIDNIPGNNDAGPVTVTVEFLPNAPPVAVAGEDQSVSPNALVTLDGSASYDPNGHTPLTFNWMQIGGAPLVLLSSTTISMPTFTAPITPTVLTFALTVTDSLGMPSVPDTVVVTVAGYYIHLPLVLKN